MIPLRHKDSVTPKAGDRKKRVKFMLNKLTDIEPPRKMSDAGFNNNHRAHFRRFSIVHPGDKGGGMKSEYYPHISSAEVSSTSATDHLEMGSEPSSKNCTPKSILKVPKSSQLPVTKNYVFGRPMTTKNTRSKGKLKPTFRRGTSPYASSLNFM